MKGPSDLRAGVYAFPQQDNTLFAVTSTDPSVTPFRQTVTPHGQVDAAFVNELWKMTPWWIMSGGLRFTYFDGSFSERAWDPRVGTAITLPRLNWVLRGSYSRYYQAPPLDTVTGSVLQFAQTQDLGFLPLHGERDEQYDVCGSGFLNGDGPSHLPSYRTFDLALNKDVGERWTIRAIGTNITNKRYQVDLSNTFGGSHVGDPRMLSLEARHRFNF